MEIAVVGAGSHFTLKMPALEPLPALFESWVRQQLTVHELSVCATLERGGRWALEPIAADPSFRDSDCAPGELLDALLEVNLGLVPALARARSAAPPVRWVAWTAAQWARTPPAPGYRTTTERGCPSGGRPDEDCRGTRACSDGPERPDARSGPVRLALYRHLWGVPDSIEAAFPRFKTRGYEGIEAVVPAPDDRPRFRECLDEHGLAYAAQVITRGADAAEHLGSLRAQLEGARSLGASFAVCHAGRDGWPERDVDRFIAEALEVVRDLGLPTGFETHRGRVTYNPWATARLLERFPDLRLTCDFSHWVVVCERLLDGPEEAIVRECAERALHLHARVGHEQGPQVSDPRAPEWAAHLEAHERWWRLVWEAQARRGSEVSTLTPELGPPNYLPTLPHTRAPVVDLEAACDWMAERQLAAFRSAVPAVSERPSD